MAAGRAGRAPPFADAVTLWRAVGGGIDSDGNVVGKPSELTRAEFVLYLCDRWHQRPDDIGSMSTEVMHLLDLERLARGGEQ